LLLLKANLGLLENTSEFLDGLLKICGQEVEVKIEEELDRRIKEEVVEGSTRGLIPPPGSEVSDTGSEDDWEIVFTVSNT